MTAMTKLLSVSKMLMVTASTRHLLSSSQARPCDRPKDRFSAGSNLDMQRASSQEHLRLRMSNCAKEAAERDDALYVVN